MVNWLPPLTQPEADALVAGFVLGVVAALILVALLGVGNVNGDPQHFPRGPYVCEHCEGGTMQPGETGVYPRRIKYVCDRCRHAEWWVLEQAEPETEKPA